MRRACLTFKVWDERGDLLRNSPSGWRRCELANCIGVVHLQGVGHGVVRMRVKPWWGPECDFGLIDLGPFVRGPHAPCAFRVQWDAPTYQLFVNGELVSEVKDPELAIAAELGMPYEVYQRLKGTRVGYDLRKAHDPMGREQYIAWELEEMPVHLREAFGITGKVRAEDVRWPIGNQTKEARERVAAFEFARAYQSLCVENRQIAILTPKPDRGTDCYIRVINVAQAECSVIPLQVIEIHIAATSTQTQEDAERHLFETVEASKLKPRADDDEVLLCKTILVQEEGQTRISPMNLREYFDKYEWPFRKVVLSMNAGAMISTVYSRDHEGHFIWIKKESGRYEAHIGRTEADITRNAERARIDGTITHWL